MAAGLRRAGALSAAPGAVAPPPLPPEATAQVTPHPRKSVFEAPPPKPKSHLFWAVFTTLFCFMPLGVVAIVFAAQVNSRYDIGDYDEAERYSELAGDFVMWSALVALVGFVLTLLGLGVAFHRDIAHMFR